MKHKHYDCIVAWAEGKQIEYSLDGNIWQIVLRPEWDNRTMYRIKPEPMPDVPRAFCVDNWGHNIRLPYPHTNTDKPNLRLVFETETGILKSAEVLK
jgi:hypothetical protein